MMIRALIVATCTLTYVESAARADPKKRDEVTTYAFEDDAVTGAGQRPEGEILQVRKGSPRSSLIRVRVQFIDRLLQAVTAL